MHKDTITKDRKITLQFVVVACFVLFSLFIFSNALRNPIYNWDMIPYMAAAKSFEIHDKKILHEITYSSLKKFVPAKTYEELTRGDYRKTMSVDAEAFEEQMPFYKIKVIYVFLIFLFDKMGVAIFMATYLISAISVIAGLWCLYGAFRKHITPLYFIPFLYFAFLLNVQEIAKLSTPDGLAFFLFAAIIYSLMKENRALFVLLPLSVLVRTDLIIFSGMISLYLFIRHPKWRLFSIMSLIVSIGIYFFINTYYGNYGWNTLISFSFLQTVSYPSQIAHRINIADYLDILVQQTKKILKTKELQIYIGTLLISFMSLNLREWKRTTPSINRRVADILLLTFAYAAVHFILFPSISLRFFIAPYIVGLLGFLYFAQNKFSQTQ